MEKYINLFWDDTFIANIFAACLVVLLFSMFYKPSFTLAMILFVLLILKNRRLLLSFCFRDLLNEQKGMIIFLLTILLAACGTGHFDNVQDALNKVYYTFPFFMLAYASKIANIKKGILIGLVIVVVAGTISVSYEWLIKNVDRPLGLLRHPNTCALCMGMIMPIFIYYVIKCKNMFLKFCSAIIVGFCTFSLLLVKSRGVNIAILTCIALLIMLYLYKKSKVLSLAFGLALPCILYIYHNELLVFLHRGYDGERLLLYKTSIKMWLDYPVFGTGFADWSKLYNGSYYPVGAKEHLTHSHNTFLHVLSAAGIVGLSGYLFFLYSFALRCVNLLRRDHGYALVGLSALVIFILHSIVDSPFSVKYVQRFFWLMFFIYQYSEMERVDG